VSSLANLNRPILTLLTCMLRILHTNDFHGTLDDNRQGKLSDLRAQADVYFDCGDCVKAGNLAIPLKPEAVWPRLAALNCTASVPGNRESHPLEGPFKAKMKGATTPILCANLKYKDSGKLVLSPSMLIEAGGLRIGVFGVMVAIVTARMASRVASHYLWDDPIKTAQEQAEQLRPNVDILIALTHIGFKKDVQLATQCPKIDLVLGGHSHTILEKPVMVGDTAICQTGSHARFAGLYKWDSGKLIDYKLLPLS